MKIYLATSWSNPYHGPVRRALMQNGHEVHDFKADEACFWWGDLLPDDEDHENLHPDRILELMRNERVQEAFQYDMAALEDAEVGLVLEPAGRSAHLEVGYMAGQGKPIHALYLEGDEPDTALLLAGVENIHADLASLIEALETPGDERVESREVSGL